MRVTLKEQKFLVIPSELLASVGLSYVEVHEGLI